MNTFSGSASSSRSSMSAANRTRRARTHFDKARQTSAITAAIAPVLTLTGCFNAPHFQVAEIPSPEDVVGSWVNPDDGGQIVFHADGTCELIDIPEGALGIDPPGEDGKPVGPPVATDDCAWRADDDRPGIDLYLEEHTRGTSVAVFGETEIAFWLGDPDQGKFYELDKATAP